MILLTDWCNKSSVFMKTDRLAFVLHVFDVISFQFQLYKSCWSQFQLWLNFQYGKNFIDYFYGLCCFFLHTAGDGILSCYEHQYTPDLYVEARWPQWQSSRSLEGTRWTERKKDFSRASKQWIGKKIYWMNFLMWALFNAYIVISSLYIDNICLTFLCQNYMLYLLNNNDLYATYSSFLLQQSSDMG